MSPNSKGRMLLNEKAFRDRGSGLFISGELNIIKGDNENSKRR